ncbi:MAG: thioredoxin family protein [Planctomycetes bacterium]|nr:thioredoxin family protein [Planctomycetota bacterium]
MKLSEKLPRVLVDCTDRGFFREMTRKHRLQGLPTLALLDADGEKLDEVVGFSPDAALYAAFLRRAAETRPPSRAGDSAARALERIDRLLRESEARLREEIARVLRAELGRGRE